MINLVDHILFLATDIETSRRWSLQRPTVEIITAFAVDGTANGHHSRWHWWAHVDGQRQVVSLILPPYDAIGRQVFQHTAEQIIAARHEVVDQVGGACTRHLRHG